jgi:hypothetical protein
MKDLVSAVDVLNLSGMLLCRRTRKMSTSHISLGAFHVMWWKCGYLRPVVEEISMGHDRCFHIS